MTLNRGPIIRAPAFANLGSRYETRIAQDVHLQDGSGLVIGHTAQINAAGVAEMQVLGTDDGTDSVITIASFNTTGSVQPLINLVKSGAATIGGANVIMADGENLGAINWMGDDGNNLATVGARIQATIDGTPDTNDLPTALKFFTALGAAQDDLAEKMRISPAGDLHISDGGGIVVGHTAQVNIAGLAELQVLGTSAADSTFSIGNWNTTNSEQPVINMLKSGNATIGSNTIVADGENLGAINWIGDDSNNYATAGARIQATIDGTPDVNDLPTALKFFTAPGAAQDDLAEKWRITPAGMWVGAVSVDSAAVADQVGISRYEIGAGNTVLALSQETAVAADTDETKFSHKVQMRINGATYFVMLTDS